MAEAAGRGDNENRKQGVIGAALNNTGVIKAL